jgi:outer membrane protein assembly complex protein YaeT
MSNYLKKAFTIIVILRSNLIPLLLIVLIFSISLSDQRVYQVSFDGNNSISDWNLNNSIILKNPTWIQRLLTILPKFEINSVKDDLKTMRALFVDKGFLDVSVEAIFAYNKSDSDYIMIKYMISEGILYKISEISLNVPKGIDSSKILKKIDMNIDHRFSPFDLDAKSIELRRFVEDKGYPYSLVITKYAKQDSSINITIDINTGKKAYFGNITYKGLLKTKKSLLLRELTIDKGNPYSSTSIQKSMENLYQTGLFKIVTLDLVDTTGQPDTVNLELKVIERKTGGYGFSLDFGADKNYDFTVKAGAEWSNRNVFRSGNALSIKGLVLSEVVSRWQILSHRYELSTYRPWTFNKRIPTNFVIFFEPEAKNVDLGFSTRRYGVNLNSYLYNGNKIHSGGLSYEVVDIFGVSEDQAEQIREDQGISISRKINYTFQTDTRDNPIVPTNGIYFRTSVDFVGGFLGGDEDYLKIDASLSNYIKPLYNLTYANRIRVGIIGRTTQKLNISTPNKYVTGGANSVRGFDALSIGPKENSSVIGGQILFLLNFEVRYPIISNIWGNFFVDFGQVWLEWKDINPTDIRASMGIGLAYMTPVGPIRLERGFILTHLDPEQTAKWHISLMYPF